MEDVNFASITYKVSQSLKVQSVLKADASDRVENAKSQLLEDFDEHPITQELKDGEYAGNTSGLLNGYGNLFSFIGFYAGDEPTEIIRNWFIKYIKLIPKPIKHEFKTNKNMQITFKVQYPSFEELMRVTEYPDGWREGSWLYGIEHGIFGLSYYLYDEEFDRYEQSRSTSGLMAKRGDGSLIVIRGNSQSKPSKYVNALLKQFIKNLRQV